MVWVDSLIRLSLAKKPSMRLKRLSLRLSVPVPLRLKMLLSMPVPRTSKIVQAIEIAAIEADGSVVLNELRRGVGSGHAQQVAGIDVDGAVVDECRGGDIAGDAGDMNVAAQGFDGIAIDEDAALRSVEGQDAAGSGQASGVGETAGRRDGEAAVQRVERAAVVDGEILNDAAAVDIEIGGEGGTVVRAHDRAAVHEVQDAD